jgi:two-component system LytT family response regulator
MRCVIIEDEVHPREYLRQLLALVSPSVEIIAEADDVKSGAEVISTLKPDLVFMDIMLKTGTAFDLLNLLVYDRSKVGFKIIFTTAYDHYTMKCIKLGALDYLVKPINKNDLRESLKYAESIKASPISQEQLNFVINQIRHPEIESRKIALSTSDRISIYAVDSIIRCEGDDNYTRFIFNDEKPILVSRTIKEFASVLEPLEFFRVHKSHLVNLRRIKSYLKTEGGSILMDNGDQVPISLRKKDDFISRLRLIGV